jgi:pimeloyl-ACP methyl ester carboxylesterase
MSNAEIILVAIAVVLVALILGNFIFQVLAERRNPPIGRFTECDGIRLHYIDRGKTDAPCVVLFHGNGTMIQDLTISGLVDLLARDSRVICFDRPGFGHSPRPRSKIWTAAAQADLFVKILEQLNVREPVVVGHSWGTLVAVAVALRKDYWIRGLVLASGYYFPTARWDVWLMSGPAIPVFGDLLRYTIAPIISWAMLPSLLRKIFAPQPVPEQFRHEFPVSLTLRPKQLRAAAEESAFLIPVTSQLQSQYSRVDCPVHIIHGRDDEVIEAEQSQRLHDVIRGSELHLISHAGHMVTYQATQRIYQTIAGLQRRAR